MIIGNGVVARLGQKFRRFPFGFEPIFHFHAEDAVVAAVDDPIHIFFAVDFVGVRVDRAHVVPHVVFADARIDSRRFAEFVIFPRFEEDISCKIIGKRVFIIAAAVVLFDTGLLVIGMQIFLPATVRIFEVDEPKSPVGIFGNGNVRLIIRLASDRAAARHHAVVLFGRGAEKEIISALAVIRFGIVDDFGRPQRVARQSSCKRSRAVCTVMQIVKRVAHHFPIGKVFGTIRIERTGGRVHIVIAVARRVVEYEGIGAVRFFVVAVEQCLVVIRLRLPCFELTLIIRNFILRFVLHAASRENSRRREHRARKHDCPFAFFHLFSSLKFPINYSLTPPAVIPSRKYFCVKQ